MKFLCDSCKAKYQIADEKVAGKTVRMKCRKCGHQIEVRAAVTETSVASSPPKAMPGATMTGPAAPRPPAPRGLATSLSAQKPRSPATATQPPSSALAGAFQRNVNESPASVSGSAPPASIELSVTDEWYVAINGVPVGPVRISELRRKAAAGAVTEESLCWQEGLEEWRPIRSIPDLAALVREAAAGGSRGSYVGPPPEAPAAPRPPPPPPARPAAPARASVAPAPPRPFTAPLGPAPMRSNVVPLRPAASGPMDDPFAVPHAPTMGGGLGNSAAAFAPSVTPAPPAPMFSLENAPNPLSAPVADPFAVPPAPVASPFQVQAPYRESVPPPAGVPFDLAHSSIHPAPAQRSVPLWFWPILLLALGFGGGVAFLVFRPQPTPAPVVIQMPQPTATATVAEPAPTHSAEPVASAAPDTKKPVAVAQKGAPAKPPEERKGLDLGGLVPNGGGGPNVGPAGGGGPSAGGGGLDSSGIERVVATHRQGVKRTCWERGGADKSSVNVTVTANVAPNGTVASTSSSGDDPVVAKCIEGQVRSWQFPPPGANTTVNIPFKFVRQ